MRQLMANALRGSASSSGRTRARRLAAGVAFLFVAAAAGLLDVRPAHAQRLNVKRTIRIVTSSLANQSDPAISGNFVVFVDDRVGNSDIRYIDLAVGGETQITSGLQNERQPDISGFTIVYTDLGSSTGGGDILGYVIGGGPITVAADALSSQSHPAISGSLVAWEDTRDGNREIYARDLATGLTRRLTTTPDAQEVGPAVSGTRVVYSRQQAGACQIFVTDFVTGATTQVSQGPGCFSQPDIDGDTVVYDGDPDGNRDVYVVDLATLAETRIVLAGVQENAHVSGEWLSAEKIAAVPFVNSDVKIYNIPRAVPFGAIITEFNETADDIDGLKVVYQTDERGNLDIGLLEFELVASRNRRPVANAGPDQVVPCASVAATPVALDGSGSFDLDEDPFNYTWSGPFPEHEGLAGGVAPTVSLPLGTSIVTLVTNDGQEDSIPDTVTIDAAVLAEGLSAALSGLAPEDGTPGLPGREFRGGNIGLRLRLSCGGAALTDVDVAAPVLVAIEKDGVVTDPATLGPTEFRSAGSAWSLHLGTKSLAPGAYQLTILMPDGRRWKAPIVLR